MSHQALRRFLPIILLLFVGSGCAALIYEVVWLQLLQLLIGSSAVSLAVLLGTYMGGMCLGSFLLPRYVSRLAHPLRIYAWIELGIGLFGLIVLFGVPRAESLYAALPVRGSLGIIARAFMAALFLLVPTLLMGASLPAIARWVQPDRGGISWLGWFYGGNIAGAVLGSLLAGFYFLRIYDMAVATYAAVTLNAIVAVIALVLAHLAPRDPVPTQREAGPARPSEFTARQSALVPANPRSVYLAIGLSGACALGAEVVWTRLLSLMLGATVYTFSIILAVFLSGLGIGSAVGAWLARGKRPLLGLGICQCLLALATAWAAYAISTVIPSPTFDPTILLNPSDIFRLDLARSVWAILPAALLWGASFPLALAASAGKNTDDAGTLAGQIYAANTLGGIAGALLFSIVLIPEIGTLQAQRALVLLSLVSGCVVLWAAIAGKAIKIITLSALAVTAAALCWTIRPVPWLALAYGRRMNQYVQTAGKPLYIGEGRNSSIVVSELTNGTRYFHVSGKVEATTEPFDMRLQRMLGHLSALFHAKPESVLVVGFGAGVTAGSFTLHPDVKKITISEIEPLIPPASTRYFNKENYDVLHDPRTHVVYDDARHFVLTSDEKFDIITSDPIHPWVKGTSTLYSKEYFEMCKAHLKPGGVVTQWVPLYESDFDTVKSELATFFHVFPHATIWNSDASNQGYDVVLVGQASPGPIDIDAWTARLARPDHARVRESLAAVQIYGAQGLLATFAGRDDELSQWLSDAEINRDINMRLQYLAGWGLNFNRPDVIYLSMIARRGYPADLFTGSPANVAMLYGALERQRH